MIYVIYGTSLQAVFRSVIHGTVLVCFTCMVFGFAGFLRRSVAGFCSSDVATSQLRLSMPPSRPEHGQKSFTQIFRFLHRLYIHTSARKLYDQCHITEHSRAVLRLHVWSYCYCLRVIVWKLLTTPIFCLFVSFVPILLLQLHFASHE